MVKRKAFISAKYGIGLLRKRNLAGFTLIEIVIAMAIFSFAMVIATGTFSTVLGSQSYVAVNSEVNREAQRIVRQISDDTVNAVGTGVVSATPSFRVRGMMFLKNNKPELPASECLKPGTINCNFDGLVLFSNSGLKIYRFNSANKSIEYALDPSTTLQLDTLGKIDSGKYAFSKISSDKVEIIAPGFQGRACYTSDNCNLSPFVRLDITTQTANYGSKAARNRAKLQIKTMVSSRSY